MLKFNIVFSYCLCFFHQVWSAPIVKASGVQWTDPKGNGKGNLTIIMIPQNNSCTNDTDILVGIKSDYQVVSQDTQLLNLVINEYINDTLNETLSNEKENQNKGVTVVNSSSTNTGLLNKSTCSDDSDRQHKQLNQTVQLTNCPPQNNTGSETTCNKFDILKFLSIPDPNIETNKINDQNIIHSTPSVLVSNNNLFDEAINIIGQLNHGPSKREQNLRSDTISGNQVEELIALEEGDFDTKAKLSNAASATQEEMLKKQMDLLKLNKIDKSKAEESLTDNNSEDSSSILTTCFAVDFDEMKTQIQESEITQGMSSEITLQATPFIPQGEVGNVSSVVNTDEATIVPSSAMTVSSVLSSTSSLSSASVSPPCRTSIIYICDQQNEQHFTGSFDQVQTETVTSPKSQAEMQELPKKITLSPPVDCVSIFNSLQSSSFITTIPDIQQNQNVRFEKKILNPLVESSLFLANNNEMPKGKSIPILLNTSDYMLDTFSSNDNRRAKFHGNPSYPRANNVISEDSPQKMCLTKNNPRKRILSIKHLKKNDQGVLPGPVVKMRFAGKHIIVEQMPSYRSGNFNKNCGSTPITEPPSDEMEPDEEENEILVRTKTSEKSKPTITIKSTYEQIESTGSSTLHTTRITSNQPVKTSISKTETTTKQYKTTTEVEETQSLAQGPSTLETTAEQPEVREKTYPQTITETTSEVEKTSKTEEESRIHITECETIKVTEDTPVVKKQTTCQSSEQESCDSLSKNEQSNKLIKLSTNKTTKSSLSILEDEYSSQIKSVATKSDEADTISTESYLVSDLIAKFTTRKSMTSTQNVQDYETSLGFSTSSIVKDQPDKISAEPQDTFGISVTEEPQFLTSSQKLPEKDQNCDKSIVVPEVKEIVIQIIRNTKKPENKLNNKSSYNYRQYNHGTNDIYYKLQNIQQPPAYSKEEIKSGSYEMESGNSGKNKQEDIEYPERREEVEENQLGSISKYNPYPYYRKENMDNSGNWFSNKEMQKNDKISKAFIQNSDKNYDAVSNGASKVLVDGNNVIYGVYQ